MAQLTWSRSGQGECCITLEDARQLAVDAGFIFKGSDPTMPMARRADLQAMFDRFGVNSLSSFRLKFWQYELRPEAPTAAAKGSSDTAAAAAAALPSTAASRSRWQVQQQGPETYVGEALDGRRHGLGMLLSKGERSWVLHVGRFIEGKRNGPGVVVSTRGERFEGHFMDDVMWGPGVYCYPPLVQQGKARAQAAADASCAAAIPGPAGSDAGSTPAEAAAAAPSAEAVGVVGGSSDSSGSSARVPEVPCVPRHRMTFEGMMNGRPMGKGCLTWSDGSWQVGQFDGNNCYMQLRQEEVAGVLMVAGNNAEAARAAAGEVQQQAQRQKQHIAQEAQRLLAAVFMAPVADSQTAAGA